MIVTNEIFMACNYSLIVVLKYIELSEPIFPVSFVFDIIINNLTRMVDSSRGNVGGPPRQLILNL